MPHTASKNVADVIVIGMGAAGSAIVDSLARRKVNVIGIEQFPMAHNQGSSHGQTRLIRKSYFEDPAYVPLLEAAFLGWRALENRIAKTLFEENGLVTIGPDTAESVVGRTKRAAKEHQLPLEQLDTKSLATLFPQAVLRPQDIAIYEQQAGYLHVESCIEAFCNSAALAGAQMHFQTQVQNVTKAADRYEITTDRGRFTTKKLVYAAGAWTPQLLPRFKTFLEPQRVTQHWWKTTSPHWHAPSLPCFAIDVQEGLLYGFPPNRSGLVKSALHTTGSAITDPYQVDREIKVEDYALPSRLIGKHLHGLDFRSPVESSTCIYTLTYDQHFLVDFVPDDTNVLLVSACSGHGFKFAPILGEMAADLITTDKSRYQIPLFQLTRLLTNASVSPTK